MKNSNESVKSRGVVVFAFDTDSVQYTKIADLTARLVQKNLNLPVTIITDRQSRFEFEFDNIIYYDPAEGNTRTTATHQTLKWRNFDRYMVYDLTPYDQTILLDTDYLVLSDSLLKLLDTPHDYLLQHHSTSDVGLDYSRMGPVGLPFVWATTVIFNKCDRSQMLFNLVARVQRNYNYYRALYHISDGNYRNDYAFAIANNILNGYSLEQDQTIPWPMFTLDKTVERMQADSKFIYIQYGDQHPATVTPHMDLHILDKQYLQTEEFAALIKSL